MPEAAMAQRMAVCAGRAPSPVDVDAVEDLVDRYEDAVFQARLSRQKTVPRIAVLPFEMGGILRMIVGDNQFLDDVAPERSPQFLRRQGHAPALGLQLNS